MTSTLSQQDTERKMTRVAIYVRVSTTEQTTLNQTQILTEIANKNQWIITSIYEDKGISGTTGREKRPAFDQLCTDMMKGEFERILVWDISRLGRSLKNLVEFLHDALAVQCDLYVHQSGLDTSTSAGKMMFQMIGVFSEFERSMISERVKCGLVRVKAQGKTLGRPKSVTQEIADRVTNLLILGKRQTEIAATLNISKMTVCRINKQLSMNQNRVSN